MMVGFYVQKVQGVTASCWGTYSKCGWWMRRASIMVQLMFHYIFQHKTLQSKGAGMTRECLDCFLGAFFL